MRTLQISISELEYQKLGIKEEQLHFSELLDIISREDTMRLQQFLLEKLKKDILPATKDDISYEEIDYQKFGIEEKQLLFSELLDIISRKKTKIGLQQVVELSEKYGLSAMTMDDISAEVKAVRNEKRNY